MMSPAFSPREDEQVLESGHGHRFMRKTVSCEPLGKDLSEFGDLSLHEQKNLVLSSGQKSQSDAGNDSYTVQGLDSLDDEPPFLEKPASHHGTPPFNREDDDVFVDNFCEDYHPTQSPRKQASESFQLESSAKVDPQTMYAGSSCMFVANLPQQYSDDKLEEEVTKAFSNFGTVFVKVKRDGRGMPFAFCQYTNDTEAHDAMTLGKGTMFLDRPCRTEMARAQSSFIVYKISGQRIRPSEARDLLRRLGEISKTEYLSEAVRLAARLPQTVVVTYKMYDPQRDPQRVFANDPTYCVKVFDPKSFSQENATDLPGSSFLKQYDKDRRSAYVGNLPSRMTKDVLRSLASSCGEVLDIQLHHKEVPGLHGKFCEGVSIITQLTRKKGQVNRFGFVEFSRPDAPDELIEALHDTEIDGYRLRVERKQFRDTRRFDESQLAVPSVSEELEPRLWMRRQRAGSFELEKPSSSTFDLHHGGSSRPARRKPYISSSFTPGRSRNSRPSILDTGMSPASRIFEPPTPSFTASPLEASSSSRFRSSIDYSPHAQNTAGFDLPGCMKPVANLTSRDRSANAPFKVNVPEVASSAASSFATHSSALGSGEPSPLSPTSVSWMAPYPHFGYHYLGGPMAPSTPQQSPGINPMVYASYMPPPMYHTFYDIYGNIVIPPTHAVPSFGAAESTKSAGEAGGTNDRQRSPPEPEAADDPTDAS